MFIQLQSLLNHLLEQCCLPPLPALVFWCFEVVNCWVVLDCVLSDVGLTISFLETQTSYEEKFCLSEQSSSELSSETVKVMDSMQSDTLSLFEMISLFCDDAVLNSM